MNHYTSLTTGERVADLSKNARRVLNALIVLAGDDDSVTAFQPEMLAVAGMGVNPWRKALNELEDKNLATVGRLVGVQLGWGDITSARRMWWCGTGRGRGDL